MRRDVTMIREMQATALPRRDAPPANGALPDEFKTLAELNVNPVRLVWSNLTLEHRYAVGLNGRALAGQHVHLLNVQAIVADSDPRQRKLTTGDTFSSDALCGGNFGQHGARPYRGSKYDTLQITCSKCLRLMRKQYADRFQTEAFRAQSAANAAPQADAGKVMA